MKSQVYLLNLAEPTNFWPPRNCRSSTWGTSTTWLGITALTDRNIKISLKNIIPAAPYRKPPIVAKCSRQFTSDIVAFIPLLIFGIFNKFKRLDKWLVSLCQECANAPCVLLKWMTIQANWSLGHDKCFRSIIPLRILSYTHATLFLKASSFSVTKGTGAAWGGLFPDSCTGASLTLNLSQKDTRTIRSCSCLLFYSCIITNAFFSNKIWFEAVEGQF